jgi:hypothetical protein
MMQAAVLAPEQRLSSSLLSAHLLSICTHEPAGFFRKEEQDNSAPVDLTSKYAGTQHASYWSQLERSNLDAILPSLGAENATARNSCG